MKTWTFKFFLAASLLFLFASNGSSAEHPGTAVPPGKSVLEHPGKPVEQPKQEHPGKTVEQPKTEHPGKPITADIVKESIRNHIDAQSKTGNGVFIIRDEKLNKEWRLKLSKVHDPVRVFEKDGKTIYFTCVDMSAADGKDVLDLDFWMVPNRGKLEVTDTRIHKLNGEPRYTYEGITIKEVK